MNIVHMVSRDVTDRQQRNFALISMKVPKARDVKTPSPLPRSNQCVNSNEPTKVINSPPDAYFRFER